MTATTFATVFIVALVVVTFGDLIPWKSHVHK